MTRAARGGLSLVVLVAASASLRPSSGGAETVGRLKHPPEKHDKSVNICGADAFVSHFVPSGVAGPRRGGAGMLALVIHLPDGAAILTEIVGGGRGLYGGHSFPPSVSEVVIGEPRAGDYPAAGYSRYQVSGADRTDVGVRSLLFAAAPASVSPPFGDLNPHSLSPPSPESAGWIPKGSPADVVFWTCAIALAYTYLGYPLFVWTWSCLRPRAVRRREYEATLSVLVVAQNEARRIQERVENLLALDYPPERLEVMLASDGSTDGTEEQARRYAARGLRVFAFATRRGKPAVLNEVVPQARGEIVVLADARQRFEAGVLHALVAPFADPSVGAVSGELFLANAAGTAVGDGVGLYWRYEKFIRRNESRVDSLVGATGAIYAIRRDLFEPIPEDTVLDDVLIPLRIVRRGYRAVFEPEARAYDRAAATAAEEFTRKVRTIAGNFQLFAVNRWLLSPRRNRLWLQTLSHKGLRLLTPVLLATALTANLLLTQSAFYIWTLAGQVAFYTAAVSGWAFRDRPANCPLLTVPYMICLLSWATVVAFMRFLSGRQTVTWERASA